MKPGHLRNLVSWQRIAGPALRINDLTLIPQSRALIIRFPSGAVIWHRPTAVQIERDGRTKALPVVDLTRILQVGIYSLGAIVIIACLIGRLRGKEYAP